MQDEQSAPANGPTDEVHTRSAKFQEQFTLARAGSSSAVGELFEICRNYLLLVAGVTVKRGLQSKVGASDLVQETFAEAHRIFDRFEGTTESELLRWLTQILEYKIGNTLKRYRGTARRDVKREVPLDQHGEKSLKGLASNDPSPSTHIRALEQRQAYQQALNCLSKEEREVIQFRIGDHMTFEEIGLRTNRSADAARKFYARAIARVQLRLGDQNE